MIVRIPHFALLTIAAFSVFGCGRLGQYQGVYAGHFCAYYADAKDAEKAESAGSKTFKYKDSDVTISPRGRDGENEQMLGYDISVRLGHGWDVSTDDKFRAILSGQLAPFPDEIHAIALHGVTHSERTMPRTADIQEFWEYVSERPHAGFSKNEIEQLVPNQYVEHIRKLNGDGKCILEWPHDERSLILEFRFNADKNATIMDGCGLGYATTQ
jgi:hypothetical protein